MFTICAFNEFDCVHISVSLTKQADFNCSLFPSIVTGSRFHNTRFNPKVRSLMSARVRVFFLLFLSFFLLEPHIRSVKFTFYTLFLSTMHHEFSPFYFRSLLQQWPIVISADEAAGLFETKYV